jgi:hypothetical protein
MDKTKNKVPSRGKTLPKVDESTKLSTWYCKYRIIPARALSDRYSAQVWYIWWPFCWHDVGGFRSHHYATKEEVIEYCRVRHTTV